MEKLLEYIHAFLLENISESFNIEIFYEEGNEDALQLPYMVYTTSSDMSLSKVREDVTFTLNFWGVSEHKRTITKAVDKIKELVSMGVVIDACKPLAISTEFMSRMDVPVQDQRLRCTEVRFKVSLY
ncbi:hypothetical protein [Bacillus sp. COPE52]|uniref:hypothetical protein n=1 Tax=Bacillus sp. COPE52 TaxID=2233998 RepID=UPI000E10194E|nr:hypothetical protein [Bacillus sp. COPE52]AXK19125.1 hypothetical protein DPQ31_16070 [Bacillus sp. COPE52]